MAESIESIDAGQSSVRGRMKGLMRRARIRASWAIQRRRHHGLKRLGLLPPPDERRIVVGLGLHRTGTRSLIHYLGSLGFRGVHWPWWCERQASKHLGNVEAIAAILEPLFYTYDAFVDVPFPGLYRVLDQRFPSSRFILVRRDPDAWWQSLVRHWELESRPRRFDPFEAVQYAPYGLPANGIVSIEDRHRHIAIFRRHVEAVQGYFEGRVDKLLVVDLEDEQIAERISAFLDKEVRPYPLVTQTWPSV